MKTTHTIAFYNLENLFDTENDPYTLDDDFTNKGKYQWSEERYEKKLNMLATVVAGIGSETTKKPPAIIGVVEVENKAVLNDLIASSPIENIDYDIVHYDSPDERGIDVALLYDKDFFKLLHSEVIPIEIFESDGKRDDTRDGLYVRGLLNNEETHIFVCHWPSRRGSVKSTNHKRVQAATQMRDFIANNESILDDAKIIIMGDFNDGPTNESIEKVLVTDRFYNPFENLKHIVRGSLNYRGDWILFDQIIISHNFLRGQDDKNSFIDANIYDENYLKVLKGKDDGTPFRTYKGKKYIGGYSDHFPVYIRLKHKKEHLNGNKGV